MAETTLSERRNKTRLNFYERHWGGFQLIGPDKNNQNLFSNVPQIPKDWCSLLLIHWLMHTFSDWLKWSSYSYINLTDANNARIEPRCVSQYKPAFRLFKEWIHLNLSDKLSIHNVYVQCLQWMSNCPVNWAWMCTQLIGRQCLHPAQENKHENNI